jgi:hypothetical protein
MNLTKMRKASLAGTAAIAALALSATAGAFATGEQTPTFQEFSASTFQDTDGQFIVNGDEPAGSTGDLRQFYDSMVSTPKHVPEDGLIINTRNGVDDRWSAAQALNLTYCVSTAFGSNHAGIVNAMAGGTALWEGASSKVNFVYVSSQDGSCNTRNKTVVFSVEPVNSTQYIARAFFPSTPKRSRNILVDDSIFTSGSWTPSNILGHELGHTLGFRHEHTRPEAGTCFEDNNWRPLTPYDSVSIMHYPQCNGGSANLSFSSYDAIGVRAVYGS